MLFNRFVYSEDFIIGGGVAVAPSFNIVPWGDVSCFLGVV